MSGFQLPPNHALRAIRASEPRPDGEESGISVEYRMVPGIGEGNPVPVVTAVKPGSWGDRMGIIEGDLLMMGPSYSDDEGNAVEKISENTEWAPSINNNNKEECAPTENCTFMCQEELERSPHFRNGGWLVEAVNDGALHTLSPFLDDTIAGGDDDDDAAAARLIFNVDADIKEKSYYVILKAALNDPSACAILPSDRARATQFFEQRSDLLEGALIAKARETPGSTARTCRFCGKLSTRLVGSTMRFESQTNPRTHVVCGISALHPICIPVCSGGRDSYCFIKARVQASRYIKELEGKSTFNQALQRCWHCNAMETEERRFLRCAKCNVAFYCGKECQVAAWKSGHKAPCKKLAEE